MQQRQRRRRPHFFRPKPHRRDYGQLLAGRASERRLPERSTKADRHGIERLVVHNVRRLQTRLLRMFRQLVPRRSLR